MPSQIPAIVKIVTLCRKLDSHAAVLYDRLAKIESDSEVQNVWNVLACEEQEHVAIWKRLEEMAVEGEMPDVFEDEEIIIAELEESCREYQQMAKETPVNGFADGVRAATRLEFYLLHPAMSELFHFAESVFPEIHVASDYEDHINQFVSAVKAFGNNSDDLSFVVRTLSQLWNQNRRIAQQNSRDPLTGVLNRRGFFNTAHPMAHMAQRTQSEVGVFMVDADDFKKVNDTHGHSEGDQVLSTIGEVLKHSCRASDLVARYGGEEFILYLSPIDPKYAEDIAERIRVEIMEKTKGRVPCTVSIGISLGKLADDPMKDLLDLIISADKALYHAKRDGKNCFRFY